MDQKLNTRVVQEKIKQTKLSVREFAKRHHFPQSSLNAWVLGTRACKFSNIIKIADALDCSVDEIYEGKMTIAMLEEAVLTNVDTDMLRRAYDSKIYPKHALDKITTILRDGINKVMVSFDNSSKKPESIPTNNDLSSEKLLWEIYMRDDFSSDEKSKFATFITDHIKKQLTTKDQ